MAHLLKISLGLFPWRRASSCRNWQAEARRYQTAKGDIHLTEQPHGDRTDDPHPEITLRWFLRRELLSIPLFAVIVGVLLVFGISVATLLFVFLLAAVVLGLIWSR